MCNACVSNVCGVRYKEDREVKAMSELRTAYQRNDIKLFQRVLNDKRNKIASDYVIACVGACFFVSREANVNELTLASVTCGCCMFVVISTYAPTAPSCRICCETCDVGLFSASFDHTVPYACPF